jgi:hypothetical protein
MCTVSLAKVKETTDSTADIAVISTHDYLPRSSSMRVLSAFDATPKARRATLSRNSVRPATTALLLTQTRESLLHVPHSQHCRDAILLEAQTSHLFTVASECGFTLAHDCNTVLVRLTFPTYFSGTCRSLCNRRDWSVIEETMTGL